MVLHCSFLLITMTPATMKSSCYILLWLYVIITNYFFPYRRMNNCFITQCCYVQIIIGLLKLVPHDFNLQLRVPCLPLFVQRALPLLYQVNNKNMFQAGFFATVSELLLLLVSNTSGWNILEFHVHSQLLEECCNHTEVKVRKYAITVLRSLPTEHANYIERIVLPLLCSESNDDVLLEVMFYGRIGKTVTCNDQLYFF